MKKYQKTAVLLATLLLLAGGGWFLYSTGFFQAVRSLDALRARIAADAETTRRYFEENPV